MSSEEDKDELEVPPKVIRTVGRVFGWMAASIVLLLLMKRGEQGIFEDGAWVAILVAAAFGVASKRCFQSARAKEQRERDKESLSIVKDLQKRIYRRFFLYLRPFRMDQRVPQRNPQYHISPLLSNHYSEEKLAQFEALFSDAARSMAPIVSLGRCGEAIGAGRVETDDEGWRTLFRLLAARATQILLFPGATQGCMEEVRWIQANDLLSKTIFIQPPGGFNSWAIQKEWINVIAEMRKENIELPEFDKRGCLFTMLPTGAIDQLREFPNGDLNELSEVIAELRARMPKLFWPEPPKSEAMAEGQKEGVTNGIDKPV